MFDAAASGNANKPAVTAMHQTVDHLARLMPDKNAVRLGSWLEWTYAEFRHAAIKVAAAMLAAGVKRGSTLVTLIPNGIESELVLWVVAVLQLTLAPLDVGLSAAGRREQLCDYLSRLSPHIVMVSDADGAASLDEALTECGLKTTLRLSSLETGKDGWRSLEGLASSASSKEGVNAVTQQDNALEDGGKRTAGILFTSGTSTRRPKGCMMSATNVLNTAINEGAIKDLPERVLISSVNF